MNKALVRNTDPVTSHEAASYFTETRLSEIQIDVLNWFKKQPSMRATDEDLEANIDLRIKYPVASTIRTRRNELVKKGFLRPVWKTKNKNNRNQIVWEVVNADSGLKPDTGFNAAMGEGL